MNLDKNILNSQKLTNLKIDKKDNEYDIIVIGTGISGLYFGYKCVQNNINQKILFIEKQDRVGGRLASLELEPNQGYYAEGCALRYFKESDPLVANLLKELDIKSIPEKNDAIQTPKTYVELYENLKKTYPPPSTKSDRYSNVAFPTALIKGNNFNYEAPFEFSKTLGYSLFQYPINLNMSYQTLDKVTGEIQQLIDGGYQNVCNKIFQIIKPKFEFKFEYTVNKIEKCNDYYEINDELRCKKLMFTGTVNQLNLINTLAENIQRNKIDLNRYYFNYNGIRMYLRFEKPWWKWGDDLSKESQNFYKYNSLSLFEQIIYFSPNTILIYSNMEFGQTLYELIPFVLRGRQTLFWFDPKEAPELVQIIKKIFPQLIPEANPSSLNSLSKIAFKYSIDAAQFVKPIPVNEYSNFFNRLNESHNFYMISGDYTKDPGWVESCLECVENKFEDIIH